MGAGGSQGSWIPWQLLWSHDWLGLCSVLGDRNFALRNVINQAHVSPTGCVLIAREVWGAWPISGQLLSIESLITYDEPHECSQRGFMGQTGTHPLFLTAVSLGPGGLQGGGVLGCLATCSSHLRLRAAFLKGLLAVIFFDPLSLAAQLGLPAPW